jgi:hypothetical protein
MTFQAKKDYNKRKRKRKKMKMKRRIKMQRDKIKGQKFQKEISKNI